MTALMRPVAAFSVERGSEPVYMQLPEAMRPKVHLAPSQYDFLNVDFKARCLLCVGFTAGEHSLGAGLNLLTHRIDDV